MMHVSLRLRRTAAPLREAAAWFIAGGNSELWLDELTRWEIPGGELRLLPVPRSRSEPEPVGILVLVPAGTSPQTSPRSQPYGLVAGRVYLPVDARLEPELDEAELSGLLSSPTALYVLHPSAGLAGFEPDDLVRTSQLLAPPVERPGGWDRAQSGIGFSTRLISVEADEDLSAAGIIEEARGDIGSQAAALDHLPRNPGEPGSGPISQAVQHVIGFIARGIQALSRILPRGPAGSAPDNPLERWAGKLIEMVSRNLTAARFKELHRLARLLETNPDEGLKFALPMTGDASRGKAPPSGRLIPRNIGFDLGRLGGGQPADFWDIPPDLQARLRAQYLDVARRELHLGRHRRAAYIYAELLGDYSSAASVLAAGRHYREAAVLYRERLHRPMDAARCLEQGGLLHEAISLYEELAQFEKAAELYRRLDEAELARAAYRRAVDQALERCDLLHAAKLLEVQLDAPDEALARLDEGWASDRQAGGCLTESFQLLARRGWHEAARQRIHVLREVPAGTPRQMVVLETLSTVATTYPDDTFRTLAADTTRVLIGARLPSATSEQARPLLAMVNRLVPADRLLTRDCHRYARGLVRQPVPTLPRRAAPPGKLKGCLHPLGVIALPPGVEWNVAAANPVAWYAAGYEMAGVRSIVLVQGLWDELPAASRNAPPGRGEPNDILRWRSRALHGRPLLLAVDPQNRGPVVIKPIGGPALPPRIFATSLMSGAPLVAETPGWLADEAVGLTHNDEVLHWSVESGAGCRLTAHDGNGVPLQSRILPDDSDPEETAELWTPPIPLAARGASLYVGLGSRLYACEPHVTTPEIRRFSGAIRGLTVSHVWSRLRLAVSLSEGAVLIWDSLSGRAEFFADELPSPLTLFLRGGWLVAAGDRECQIYQLRNGRLELYARQALDSQAFSLLAMAHPNRFAIGTANGALNTYSVETISKT